VTTSDKKESRRISNKTKKIQVDESYLMNHHWLAIIYKIWMDRPELIFQMFGDPNQCKAGFPCYLWR